jgi:hypothetical protein
VAAIVGGASGIAQKRKVTESCRAPHNGGCGDHYSYRESGPDIQDNVVAIATDIAPIDHHGWYGTGRFDKATRFACMPVYLFGYSLFVTAAAKRWSAPEFKPNRTANPIWAAVPCVAVAAAASRSFTTLPSFPNKHVTLV